jgi:uncharacterized protein
MASPPAPATFREMSPLPLFPLNLVLFPGALLPLHVFEPRYRELLSDAVAGDHMFGILPPNDAGTVSPGTVGCVARIRAVEPRPDGRSHIIVSGEERFLVQRLIPSPKPYLLADIETIADLPESQVASTGQIQTLRDLGLRYIAALEVMEEAEKEAVFSDDPGLLSFQIAALIDWSHPNKHHFLEIRSAMERVTRLLHALPTLVEDAELRAAVHRLAHSNRLGAH